MKKVYSDIYLFFIKERLTQTWQFLSLAVLLALLGAPVPYLFGYLIDNIIPSGDTGALFKIVALLTILMIFEVVFSYINALLTYKVNKEIKVSTIRSMLNGIFKMPYEKRCSLHTGQLVSRLTRDVNELYHILPFGVAGLVYSVLFSTIMTGVLIYLNWKLSLMLFLLLPFVALIYRAFNKSLWEYATKDAEASANNMKYLNEVITADYEIKSYGAESTFKNLAMIAVNSYQKIHVERMVIGEKMEVAVSFFPIAIMIIVWYFASMYVIQGEITIGLIITYGASVGMIVPSIMHIVNYIAEYPNQISVFRRIQEFAIPSSEELNNPPDIKIKNIKSLQANNIDFSYQDSKKKIFDNFSYNFEAGKTYLIKAPNGFGKSTLFSLLSKQLIPNSGEILINEIPLSIIENPYKHITLLPQQINIISDTIKSNLSFGDPSISDKEMLDMLEHIGLKEWLAEKEGGLDHILASSKQKLSGGQIQRIGLARAFLRKTSILLLDEPTNNLDNNAVNHLIGTIKQLSKYTVCLIISHDDRIYPHVDKVLDLSYSH